MRSVELRPSREGYAGWALDVKAGTPVSRGRKTGSPSADPAPQLPEMKHRQQQKELCHHGIGKIDEEGAGERDQ
jgi:hypothetical protein